MSSPVQISAYSCTYCDKVSTKESIIQACIEKHEKNQLLNEKSDKIEKFIKDNYYNIFKKNMIPTDSSVALSCLQSFGTAMIAAASNMGHALTINYLEIKEIKTDKIWFSINGNFTKDKKWRFSNSSLQNAGILKKDFLKHLKKHYYLEKLLFADYTVYFSDFAQSIGIETISGGGGTAFSYTIAISRKNFPKLDKEIEEYLFLKDRRSNFLSEKQRLKNIYEEERLPSVLISDVNYAIMSSDLDILEQKKKILLEEIESLKSKVLHRKQELYREDSINIPLPDSSYDFDSERFDAISKYISKARI